MTDSFCLAIGVLLGQIFFLTYINSMKRRSKILSYIQYAENTTLYVRGGILSTICQNMSVQLEEIYH